MRVASAAGSPVEGVLVTADAAFGNYRGQARTGADGTARFPDLPDGRYLLSARTGDRSTPSVDIVVGGDPPAPVSLTLGAGAVRESIVVSASLAARRENEAGALVDVLPVDDLDARGELFALEALRGVPGSLVRQTGSAGHLAAVQMRGLPASATAVVIDGAPLRDTAAIQGDAQSLLPSLALTGVDRIEIRRGGGSTIYGSSGMGGVINIVTRAESGPDAMRLSADVGERGHAGASGAFARGGGRGGFSLGLRHLGVSGGADGDDPFRNRVAFARVGYQALPGVRFSARSLHSWASVGLNESPFPAPGVAATGVVRASPASPDAIRQVEAGTPADALDLGGATFIPSLNDPDAEQRTNYHSTLFTMQGTPNPDVSWTVRFQDLITTRENDDGPAGPSRWDPATIQTIHHDGGVRTAGARLSAARNNHRVVLGGDLEMESAEVRNPDSSALLSQSNRAVFVQGETGPADGRASLRAAVRAQRFGTDPAATRPVEGSPWAGSAPRPEGGAITADASASVAVTDLFRLRGSWGRGFRAPSLYERFGTYFSSFGYSVYGDPRLLPELSTAMDVGFLFESGDGRTGLRGAYFRSERPRIIGFGSFPPGSDPFGRFGGYENTDGGAAHGAEAGLRLALPGRMRANLQGTWTEADPPANAPAELMTDWLAPRFQFAALLSGALSDRVRWAADLHVASAIDGPLFDPNTFATRVFRFDGMRRLDLVVSVELARGLTLRGIARDVWDDAAYQSAGFRPLGRVLRVNLTWQPQ